VVRPKGVVPHYLPGANPFLGEFPQKRKIPAGTAKGGAPTTYPEYRAAMSSAPAPGVNIPRAAAVAQQAADNDLHVLPVQGGVYMLHGPGGNSAIQVGKEGALLVDTQAPEFSSRLMAEIRKLTSRPLRYIVNTHVHPENTGGNEALAKFGSTLTGGNVARFEAGFPATIVAHENVTARMSAPDGGRPAAPSAAVPADTYFGESKDFFFNGEAVMIYHAPAAHTDGDSIIHFRRSDVLVTGDIFTPHQYPVIDVARGGTIVGLIAALNRILDLTVPAAKQEGGTMVIPGKGRLCDEADVVEYRDMLTIVRDRVQDMVNKGMTLEQIKAARPTQDYDPLYGVTTGPWTTDLFVEAVYRTLKQ
jgi:glyoxylase-like metal-dependent hydrolase (beta-lactamase superfamily II)